MTVDLKSPRVTSRAAVHDCEDVDDGLCHVVSYDPGVAVCGLRFRRAGDENGRRGTHKTNNAQASPCDGCGLPRCPACAARYA